MNRRAMNLAMLLLFILILAFTLRETITAVIIIPLAYLWWLFKLYYAAIPQAIFWGLLALAAFYSAVINLLPKAERRAPRKIKVSPTRGPLETLADTLAKSQRGTYYKWQVAHRLGKDAREILSQREGHPAAGNQSQRLNGRGWNPPPEIDSYLESGLLGSFANFPRRKWFWQKPASTPLDVEAGQVVEYLESSLRASGTSEAIPEHYEITSGLDTSENNTRSTRPSQ